MCIWSANKSDLLMNLKTTLDQNETFQVAHSDKQKIQYIYEQFFWWHKRKSMGLWMICWHCEVTNIAVYKIQTRQDKGCAVYWSFPSHTRDTSLQIRVYRKCKQLLAFHKQKILLQKHKKYLIFPNIWMESIKHNVAVLCTLIKNITLIQIQGGKIYFHLVVAPGKSAFGDIKLDGREESHTGGPWLSYVINSHP